MLNFAVSLSQTQQFNIQNYKFNIPSNSFLYSPYEGAEAELGSLGIELSQLFEHGSHEVKPRQLLRSSISTMRS